MLRRNLKTNAKNGKGKEMGMVYLKVFSIVGMRPSSLSTCGEHREFDVESISLQEAQTHFLIKLNMY